MDGTVVWWQSKSLWGAIVTIVAALLPLINYSISAADQAQLVDLITGITTMIGGLIALYGRVTATKKITLFRSVS